MTAEVRVAKIITFVDVISIFSFALVSELFDSFKLEVAMFVQYLEDEDDPR